MLCKTAALRTDGLEGAVGRTEMPHPTTAWGRGLPLSAIQGFLLKFKYASHQSLGLFSSKIQWPQICFSMTSRALENYTCPIAQHSRVRSGHWRSQTETPRSPFFPVGTLSKCHLPGSSLPVDPSRWRSEHIPQQGGFRVTRTLLIHLLVLPHPQGPGTSSLERHSWMRNPAFL